MNYEELYAQLKGLEKDFRDRLNAAQKSYRAIEKQTEAGDLKNLEKELSALSDICRAQTQLTESLREAVGSFDSKAYFESGDFAAQLLECCAQDQIDVKGEFPVYEMFPYRIRIDAENQDVYQNRKKLTGIRPRALSGLIKAGQDKLNKASFNDSSFADELCAAYDLGILKNGKKPGSDLYLTSLYKLLAPMSRYRRDYDANAFAFDLARLYISGREETKSGRRFQFGSSRDIGKAIRILDQYGKEQYLVTICFYPAQ
ncbi:MAG: hypothetical protein Q4C65_13185 [Eubacteriales bacterium]|nr:hypothetical protein [Eubacteriales bacterium]